MVTDPLALRLVRLSRRPTLSAPRAVTESQESRGPRGESRVSREPSGVTGVTGPSGVTWSQLSVAISKIDKRDRLLIPDFSTRHTHRCEAAPNYTTPVVLIRRAG